MMATFEQIQWLQPAWLFVGIIPLLLLLIARRNKKHLFSYASPRLQPWAIQETDNHGRARRHLVQIAAWWLLAAALAGPRLPAWEQINDQEQLAYRDDVAIMLVMDLSPAMYATDTPPSRQVRAYLEVLDLLQQSRGERFGLVGFTHRAGLITPPTTDVSALSFYLRQAPELFRDEHSRESNIAADTALDLAQQQLQAGNASSHAILLVTAGDIRMTTGSSGARLFQSVNRIAKQDIPIFVLSLAGKAQVSYQVPSTTELLNSRTDNSRLQEVARLGGGRYSLVQDGNADWSRIYENGLGRLPSHRQPTLLSTQYTYLYMWFLAPSLALFLLATLPRIPIRVHTPTIALLLIIGLIFPPEAAANEALAHQAYRQGDYALAQVHFSQVSGYAGRFGEAASAYRREDFSYAEQQFTQALLQAKTPRMRARALFNLGNTLYQQQRFAAAAQSYRDALQYDTSLQAARDNLALALARLSAQRTTTADDTQLPGNRVADDYGRYDESQTPDWPDDADVPEGLGRDNERNLLDEQVARGERAANTSALLSEETRRFNWSRYELDAGKKKLELIEDEDIRVLREIIGQEERLIQP